MIVMMLVAVLVVVVTVRLWLGLCGKLQRTRQSVTQTQRLGVGDGSESIGEEGEGQH